MDTSKIQIGNDCLLDIGINSEWFICTVAYDQSSPDDPIVTIELRKKDKSQTEKSKLLKEITMALVEKYADAETSNIYEYSGDIERDIAELEAEIAVYLKLIDEALQTDYERGYQQGVEDEINSHHVGR